MPDRNGDAIADTDEHTHIYPDRDPYANTDGDAYPNTHRERIAVALVNAITRTFSGPDLLAHAERVADRILDAIDDRQPGPDRTTVDRAALDDLRDAYREGDSVLLRECTGHLLESAD